MILWKLALFLLFIEEMSLRSVSSTVTCFLQPSIELSDILPRKAPSVRTSRSSTSGHPFTVSYSKITYESPSLILHSQDQPYVELTSSISLPHHSRFGCIQDSSKCLSSGSEYLFFELWTMIVCFVMSFISCNVTVCFLHWAVFHLFWWLHQAQILQLKKNQEGF